VAQIVWTEPAVADLEAIADYIAIQDPAAASRLVQRVLAHVEQLTAHPESGSRPQELPRSTRYRQLVEPPCRIFYRFDGERAFVLHIMRSERKLRPSRLRR
jgi:toxin ParE1/3/4